MEKPNARGPTPSRKAHLALGEKLNRKVKPPPRLPAFANQPSHKATARREATAGKPVRESSLGGRLMIGQIR
jgi:hypothetical protein